MKGTSGVEGSTGGEGRNGRNRAARKEARTQQKAQRRSKAAQQQSPTRGESEQKEKGRAEGAKGNAHWFYKAELFARSDAARPFFKIGFGRNSMRSSTDFPLELFQRSFFSFDSFAVFVRELFASFCDRRDVCDVRVVCDALVVW